jgi:DNA-binding transcriptional LysR family regulator
MISYSNILYFLELSDALSFTKAANRLFVSQQALSSTISAMEEELGVRLFKRTAPLQLTYAGKTLRRYAEQLRLLRTQMMREMADIRDEKSGELTIGISHTRGKNLLPHVLPPFQEAYPRVKVHIFEGNNDELKRAFSQGLIELIIAQTPFDVPGIETLPLCREEVLLVVSDALLARRFGNGKQEVLARLSDKDSSHSRRLPVPAEQTRKLHARDIGTDLCGGRDLTAHSIETENIETLYEMCKTGRAACSIPKCSSRDGSATKT